MANFLTNLLFEPKGKHDPNKTYTIKDTVMSADASKVYFALQDVPAGISLTNTDYWILQMDLSASKNAMDTAAANARTQTDAAIASANTRVEDMMGKAADAVTSVTDYAAKVGMRVKGETKITKGNPMTIYPDGGSLLKVQTDIPIKQLGEGDPYPGGSRKNLYDASKLESKTINGIAFTVNNDGSIVLNGTATAEAIIGDGMSMLFEPGTYTASGCLPGATLAKGDIYVYSSTVGKIIARSYEGVGAGATFTLDQQSYVTMYLRIESGRVCNGETFYPQIEKGSTATAFQPYSNIRPITGYDKLGLNVAGKNLLPNTAYTQTKNGVTFTVNPDGSITVKGTATANTTVSIAGSSSNYSYMLPAGEYVLSGCKGGEKDTYFIKLRSAELNPVAITIDGEERFTHDGSPMWCYIYVYAGVSVDETVYPMVRLGTVADNAYAPYQDNTYTVQLGQTVYGGKFDWLTGKLTLTHKYVEYGGDTAFYSPNTGLINNGGIIRVTPLLNPVGVSEWGQQEVFSNLLPHIEGGWNDSTSSGPHIYILNDYPDTMVLLLPTSIYGTTEASVKDKLAETPLQVVYKLATPIEMQFAPNVITAVEDDGINYIYGDADLTVEWVKPLETSLTEHSNAKVDASNEALLTDIAQKECSVGNPVVINDAVANVAFQHVETIFTLKQAGSGDPYPAGGGKNLLSNTATTQTINGVTFTVNSDGSVTANGTATADTTFVIGEFTAKAGNTYYFTCAQGSASTYYFGYNGYGTAWDRYLSIDRSTQNDDYSADAYIMIKSGVTVSNVVFYPMIRLASDTDATYAPSSNIRPITGYDALNLNHAGKNVLGRTVANTVYTKNGVTITPNPDGTYTLNGTSTGDIGYDFYTQNGMSGVFLPGKTYSVSFGSAYAAVANAVMVVGYITNGSTTYPVFRDGKENDSFVMPDYFDSVIVRFRIYAGAVFENVIAYPQIEFGSKFTGYEPYQGNIYTAKLGNTVYGGKFDWLTGKLTAEWAMLTLTGSELWTLNGSGNSAYFHIPNAVNIEGISLAQANGKCSHFPVVTISTTNTAQGMSGWGSTIYMRWATLFTTVDTLKSYLAAQKAAGTPVQIAYKLATPVEIQLDPTRITTTPGINTIFGDGEFTVDWFKSYKKVAEERENLLLDSFTDKEELTGNPITMSPVGGLPFDSMVTEFSPKQAGSGDPYLAGGGRNLFKNTATSQTINGVTFTVNADGSVTANGTASAQTVFPLTNEQIFVNGSYILTGMPFAGSTTTFRMYYRIDGSGYNMTGLESGTRTFTALNAFQIIIESGYVANNLTFYPMIRLSSDPDATYAPYSNIRPITGYDALELNRAGKNLIPYYNLLSGYSDGGVTVTINADKTLTFSGTATRDAYFYLSIYSSTYTTGYVFPPGEYALSGCPAGGGTQSYRMALSLYKDGVWQEGGCTDYGSGGRFTIPEGHKVDLYIRFPSGTNANGVTFKPMIRLASVADDTYEPYQYTTYTVQIGQTVYGGKFDWLTGKLTLEWGFVELGGNAQFYSPNTMVYPNGERIRVTYVLPNFAQDSADELQLICNQFVNDHKIGGWGSGPIDNVWILTGHPDWLTMALPISVFGATESSVKAKLAETPLQVAYKLATPIEIQLTPTEICTLSGVNTIYGDGDTITAKFRQSKTISLEERLSALEAVFLNQ